MNRTLLPILLALLWGCTNAGSLSVHTDDDDSAGDDDDATGDDDDDATPPPAFDGSYAGEIVVEEAGQGPQGGFEWCAGELVVTITGNQLAGESECVSDFGGGSEEQITLTGTVDDEGAIEGEAVMEIEDFRGPPTPYKSELSGQIDDGELTVEFALTVDFGRGPDFDLEATGEAELTP